MFKGIFSKNIALSIKGKGLISSATSRFYKVLFSAIVIVSFPLSPTLIAQDASQGTELASSFSPEQRDLMDAYQDCINLIMSDIELKASQKREQLSVSCLSERDSWVSTLPELVQLLFLENIDRRIEAVLMTLAQIENVVVEAAEDTHAIFDELEALSDSENEEGTSDSN